MGYWVMTPEKYRLFIPAIVDELGCGPLHSCCFCMWHKLVEYCCEPDVQQKWSVSVVSKRTFFF